MNNPYIVLIAFTEADIFDIGDYKLSEPRRENTRLFDDKQVFISLALYNELPLYGCKNDNFQMKNNFSLIVFSNCCCNVGTHRN